MKISSGRKPIEGVQFSPERIARELFKKGDGRIAFLAFFSTEWGMLAVKKKERILRPVLPSSFLERREEAR